MKTAGIVLILFSSFAAAFLTVRKEILHCKHLDEMIRYLEFVKNQAIHYSDSFSLIVRETQSNDIAKHFSVLCDSETEPIAAWEKAVANSSLMLTEYEKELIINFGVDICSSTVELINENGNRNINELKKNKNKIISDRERKTKLSTVMVISCGLLIVLIFI